MNEPAVGAHKADHRDRFSGPGECLATEALQFVEILRQSLCGWYMVHAQPGQEFTRVMRLRVETQLVLNKGRNDIESLVLPSGQMRRPRFVPDQRTENRH